MIARATLAGGAVDPRSRELLVDRVGLLLILGAAHGLADATSAWLIGSLSERAGVASIVWLVLGYNVLAFAIQPLVGMMADWLRAPRAFAVGGLVALAGALPLGPVQPACAVALAGLGSASFHVGGGAVALGAAAGRAAGAGIFTAPGVLGLAIGGTIAAAGYSIASALAIALLFVAGMIAWVPLADASVQAPMALDHRFEKHDVIMIALLAAVALRSFAWTVIGAAVEGRFDLLLVLGAAAAIGKALGGFAADRIGWRRWTVSALLAAAAMLSVASSSIVALALSALLLQSATPVVLAAAAQLFPGRRATIAGLVLGFSIALGGVPVSLEIESSAAGAGALAVAVGAVLLWWGLRRAPLPRRAERPPLERMVARGVT